MRLFASSGFEATTMEDIAVAAAVSRATVFRHFPAKDDIVFSAEADALAHLVGLVGSEPQLGLAEVATLQAEYLASRGPAFEQRAAIVAGSARLLERFALMRMRWDGAVAAALAARRGPAARVEVEDLALGR